MVQSLLTSRLHQFLKIKLDLDPQLILETPVVKVILK